MTINEVQDRIIVEMAACGEWFDKYEYLIDQGRKLDALEDRFRTEENLIPGCQSRVWLHAEGIYGKIRFSADSDTLITKGMIALLLRVLNDRPAEEICSADLYFIRETGLSTNLSPSRANGLASIVLQMKRQAESGS
ncbi:MAG: SufE family protein [Syntrophotaleaceae bacterium]